MRTLTVLRLDCHLRANTYDLRDGGYGLCLLLQPSLAEAKQLDELKTGDRLHIELSVGLAYEGDVVKSGPFTMLPDRYVLTLTDFRPVFVG